MDDGAPQLRLQITFTQRDTQIMSYADHIPQLGTSSARIVVESFSTRLICLTRLDLHDLRQHILSDLQLQRVPSRRSLTAVCFFLWSFSSAIARSIASLTRFASASFCSREARASSSTSGMLGGGHTTSVEVRGGMSGRKRL